MQKSLIISLILLLNHISSAQNFQSELLPDGIRFPHVSTADRNQIAAIPGQCIFNTDANFVECFLDNGKGWTSIHSLLSDLDGDTQVLVEKVSDEDVIYLVGEGRDLLTVRASAFGDAILEPTSIGLNSEFRANIFLGAQTGVDISSGTNNTIIGTESAPGLSIGSYNTTLGSESGSDMTDGDLNTFIGSESGLNISTGYGNTFVGSASGKETESGSLNTNIGYRSDGPVNGEGNVFVGALSGEEISNANNNVYIGTGSGSEADGDHNIFIGYNTGGNFSTNSKLIIESNPPGFWTSPTSSLIYGDFREDYVTINSTLNVSRILKLQALESEPTCDEEAFGSIYMNGFANKLRLCTSIGWKTIALEP